MPAEVAQTAAPLIEADGIGGHRHLVLVSARGRPDHRLEPLGFLIFEWPFASTTCAVSVSLFGNLEPVDTGLLLTECLGHANPDRRFKPDH